MITIHFLLFILSFCLLAWASERLVSGASHIAQHFKISHFTIGLTIVALGTSLPEMMISILATWRDVPDIAIGNALGSNIANIGLVLGLAGLIVPFKFHSKLIQKEGLVLFFVMILTCFTLYDGMLERFESMVLISLFILLLILLIKFTKQSDVKYATQSQKSISLSGFWFILGLALLPIATEFLIKEAVYIARYFNMSELIIGLTIVAFGTSLPELATVITAILKKETDIAIGNILGSNIFNLLIVLAIPGLFYNIQISDHFLTRDMPIMFAFTILFFVLSRKGIFGRFSGAVLLIGYIAYIQYLIV